MVIGFVKIRRQDGNADGFALGDVLRNFDRAVKHRGHQRRHVLARIIALEPCRLIRDHRIADGVRLVEGIVGEIVHFVIDALRHIHRDAVGLAAADAARRVAVDERAALLFDVLDLFLGHSAAHHVRLSQRVSAETAEDLNDLLLIEDAAVGDRKNWLEQRMLVLDERWVVLAGDEARDRIHRAGAVGRDDDGKIFNGLRLEADADAGHACGLHLEHARRPALRQHLHDLRVVVLHTVHGEIRVLFADLLDRVVNDRDVAKAEEVHFQQAQFLQRGHGILRHDRVVVCGERDVIADRQARDDHTCGVGRGVARHSLERTRRVDELLHARVLLVHLLQLRRNLQRLVQRHMQRGRNELCDHIRLGIGEAQRPADVADGAACRHRTEGRDLRHMIVAVFPAHIVHDLATAGVAEVHIDIGHRHALRVQEAFEEEAVFHRVDLGDVQRIGDHRACRAAASGADRDPGALCKVHEIPYDEEIVGKAHFLDHIDLVFHLLAVFGMLVAVALGKALLAKLPQIGQRIIARRELEFRQVILAECEFDVAALRDAERILIRLRHVRKEAAHLLLGFEVILLAAEAHPVGIVHGLAHLDAHQHVLRVGVLRAEIVRVVRHDERKPRLARHAQQPLIDLPFLGKALILELEEEIPRPEDFAVFQRRSLGSVIVVLMQILRDPSCEAGGKADKALVVLPQKVHVHARAVVEAVDEAARDHIDEILIARHILAQQDQMIGLAVERIHLVKARSRRDIDLAADDRLDPGSLRSLVEINDAVHHAVIRQGDGLLPKLLDTGHHVLDAARAVKQAVFRVDVQMDKSHVFSP